MTIDNKWAKVQIIDGQVVIYRDDGEHCCGESRRDWVKVASIPVNEMKKLISGKIKEI